MRLFGVVRPTRVRAALMTAWRETTEPQRGRAGREAIPLLVDAMIRPGMEWQRRPTARFGTWSNSDGGTLGPCLPWQWMVFCRTGPAVSQKNSLTLRSPAARRTRYFPSLFPQRPLSAPQSPEARYRSGSTRFKSRRSIQAAAKARCRWPQTRLRSKAQIERFPAPGLRFPVQRATTGIATASPFRLLLRWLRQVRHLPTPGTATHLGARAVRLSPAAAPLDSQIPRCGPRCSRWSAPTKADKST